MDEQQHQITEQDGRYTCSVCCRSWSYTPRYPCPGIPQYEWGQVPDHLLTEAQMHNRGLRTIAEPVGCLWWHGPRKYIWLYDISQASLRPAATEAQLAALDKARQSLTCRHCGRRVSRKRHLYQGYCQACRFILWARERLADPDVRIVDTETTGLDSDAEVVEIAVLDNAGQVLLDTPATPDLSHSG